MSKTFFDFSPQGYSYDDLLLVPSYSEVEHRSDVNLKTKLFNDREINIPIISANMASVTESEMAITMDVLGGVGIIHRFMSPEEIAENINEFFNNRLLGVPNIGFSLGVNHSSNEKIMGAIESRCSFEKGSLFATIDVAHGHHSLSMKAVHSIKKRHPDLKVIAGNVCTVDGAKMLIDAGADAIKIGVGPGCFIPETKIKTNNGIKEIKDIKIDDKVITHKLREKKVINIIKYKAKEKLISINGITSTKSHEYYVIMKKDKRLITRENIHSFAKWIKAEDLDKEEHMLIRVK